MTLTNHISLPKSALAQGTDSPVPDPLENMLLTETELQLPLYQSILINTAQRRGRVPSQIQSGDPRDALQQRQHMHGNAGDAIVASYESVRFLPLATSSAFQIQQARRPGDSTGLRTRPRPRREPLGRPRTLRGLPARDEATTLAAPSKPKHACECIIYTTKAHHPG